MASHESLNKSDKSNGRPIAGRHENLLSGDGGVKNLPEIVIPGKCQF